MSAALKLIDIDDDEAGEADKARRVAESKLHGFFGFLQSAFEKSTFGAQLERAERLAFDSEGRRIWFGERWSIIIASVDHYGCVTQTEVAIPASMKLSKSAPQQWAYVPNHDNLVDYATVSRNLLRLKPADQRVIEAFYGNRGMRWSSLHVGRIFAVYPLTEPGRDLIRLQLAKEAREADEHRKRIDGATASRALAIGLARLSGVQHFEPTVARPEEDKPDLRDDDRIWIQWHLQNSKPDERRGKLLDKADELARYMFLDAKHAYFRVAGV